MAKDPAFLFYPGDASNDTQFMNRLERGAYFDLVKSQRLFHGFTTVQLRKILGKDFDEVFPALELILKQDDDGYYIDWVRESITKRDDYAKKQQERVANRWKYHGITMVIPKIENENENENENEIVIEKEKKEPKQKLAENVSMTSLEYGTLIQKYGEELSRRMIEKLDNYKGANGKKYKSDYKAILNWVAEEILKTKNNGKRIGNEPRDVEADRRELVRIANERYPENKISYNH